MSKSSGGTRSNRGKSSGSNNAPQSDVQNASQQPATPVVEQPTFRGIAPLRETEKAIQLKALVSHIDVYDDQRFHMNHIWTSVSENVWVPKSVINEDGTIKEWFAEKLKEELYNKLNGVPTSKFDVTYTLQGADNKKVEISEDRLMKGMEKNIRLVKEAKELGVKGNVDRMSNATLEKKIADKKAGVPDTYRLKKSDYSTTKFEKGATVYDINGEKYTVMSDAQTASDGSKWARVKHSSGVSGNAPVSRMLGEDGKPIYVEKYKYKKRKKG